MTAEPAWPAVAWTTPVLRGLDDASRATLARGGRIALHRATATIYREGDAGDSFFVVASGLRPRRAGAAQGAPFSLVCWQRGARLALAVRSEFMYIPPGGVSSGINELHTVYRGILTVTVGEAGGQ